jgi:hypothetical protein
MLPVVPVPWSHCVRPVFPALPEDGPEITGEEAIYQVGDVISLNCTSGKSYPPARLRWYINGRPVSVMVRGQGSGVRARGRTKEPQAAMSPPALLLVSIAALLLLQ